MLIILTLGFLIWATPRTLVVTMDEVRAMGGTHHPVIGVFGVMSAKNTVVNLMILTTFLSYVLYRRANRVSTRSWAGTGMAVQWAAMGIAAAIVTYYGVKRDNWLDPVTPALGYAANVTPIVAIVFFALVTFVFWLGGLGGRGRAAGHAHAAAPALAGGSTPRR